LISGPESAHEGLGDVRLALFGPETDGGNVNRSQLVTALSERIDTTRREADTVLTSIVDLITATVAAGEDVAISGFAKFRRVDRPARMGRNPATGETIRIKAKRSAKITPLKSFKDAVLSGKAPAAKKAPAKKAPAKKAPAKKTAARKAPAKKTAAKKAPARKAPAKKAVKKAVKKTTRRR
jgi:DNA-binding protein HU-beta